MPELIPADRVTALLEWGDVAEADAEIAGAGGWEGSLWRGTRALMEGRFGACERFAGEATQQGADDGDAQAGLLAGVLTVAQRREQQRVAEAEIMLRRLLEHHPSAPASAQALLALLVGEMGRDTQARMELTRLLPRDPVASTGRLAVLFLLSELAASIEAPAEELDLLYRRLRPHAGDFAVDERAAVCYGSVAFALGRLAQARGRWDDAAGHYDHALAAHDRIGAPLLLAHTQRHLATLLRMHGDEADWDRAVALLSSAASIYAHLGVDGRAADAQAVLARSGEGVLDALPRPQRGGLRGPNAVTGLRGPNATADTADEETIFRRRDDAWEIGPPDGAVRLRDSPGLHDIARLLATPHRSVHVADLLATPSPPLPAQWELVRFVLDEATRQEYEGRLAELAGELVEAERAADAVRVALVRAERDSLSAALADDEAGTGTDSLERARHAVATRIRISLDRIEQAQPPIGRHLRTSIRTGTFCWYEPDRDVRWRL